MLGDDVADPQREAPQFPFQAGAYGLHSEVARQGLDDQIVDAALATYWVDTIELKALRGLLPAHRL
ncbi:hypothetical protein [Streptomyces griseosporeus]